MRQGCCAFVLKLWSQLPQFNSSLLWNLILFTLQIYVSQFWRLGSPWSRCWLSWFLVRDLFLACAWTHSYSKPQVWRGGSHLSHFLCLFVFFFFWPCCVVYSILIPWPEMESVPLAQGSNPHPLKWKHRVLTTGLPGKSSSSLFKKCWSSHSVRTFSYHMSNCHFWIYDWGSYDTFSAQRVLPPLQNFIGAKCFWNLDFWFGNWERAAWLICLIH